MSINNKFLLLCEDNDTNQIIDYYYPFSVIDFGKYLKCSYSLNQTTFM